MLAIIRLASWQEIKADKTMSIIGDERCVPRRTYLRPRRDERRDPEVSDIILPFSPKGELRGTEPNKRNPT